MWPTYFLFSFQAKLFLFSFPEKLFFYFHFQRNYFLFSFPAKLFFIFISSEIIFLFPFPAKLFFVFISSEIIFYFHFQRNYFLFSFPASTTRSWSWLTRGSTRCRRNRRRRRSWRRSRPTTRSKLYSGFVFTGVDLEIWMTLRSGWPWSARDVNGGSSWIQFNSQIILIPPSLIEKPLREGAHSSLLI